MTIKTIGTNLYVVDPAGAGSLIIVGCVTSISGITASRDQIDVTCLEDQARSYESGMLTPGAAKFSINFDPSDATHSRLHELYVAGTTLKWALGWGDGTAAPTVDSSEDFVTPTTRSWLLFDGYISDFPFDFSVGKVVTSDVGVQISGMPTMVKKV